MTNAHGEDPARQRYYITTAIDYPNAPPHIGHSLEKVAADVVARYIAYKGTIPTLAAASTRIASTS